MNEHCMIDGVRCSKCCEVLTISTNKNFELWCKYIQKYGKPDNFNDGEHSPEAIKLYSMLKPIKRRLAKKINKRVVSTARNKSRFFTCKYLTSNGCSNYEDRPTMCSEYPYYGRTEDEWLNSDKFKRGGYYREDCTYYIELK